MNLPSQNLPDQATHLSEEALDDLLIGTASTADEHHLQACKLCSSRLANFRTSLAIFNQASAAWSDARSHTISRELAPSGSSHSTVAAWSLASVTILAVAVSLASHLHRSPDPAAAGTKEQPGLQQASNEPPEIANDNAMLVAISSKLSEPVHSPVVAYSNGPVVLGTHRATGNEARD